MRALWAALTLIGVLPGATPEERAVAYLSDEVPKWFGENKCYSCHNNGDGVRALFTAAAKGYEVLPDALAGTTAFLATPSSWDSNNRGSPAAGDNKLARIQFTAALAAAFDAKLMRDRAALGRAARMVATYQAVDGSFPFDDPGSSVGSPVTYGTPLATTMVIRILRTAGDSGYSGAIRKAEDWLDALEPRSSLDRAAVLLSRPKAIAQIEPLLKAQGADGGWGPYPNSPVEAFDTAIVVLALAEVPSLPQVPAALERGRRYLIRTQLPAGGWVATTRPAGSSSYAQHISTTAWAAMALISTKPKP